MEQYNFDQYLERRGTDSVKWSLYPEGVIPMWVADSDFSAPEPVLAALRGRVAHPAFGYSGAADEAIEEAARHWMSSRFGWRAPKGCAVFSPGVVASISLALSAFTRPGENIVTLSPSYPPLIHKAGQNGRKSLASPMILDEHGHYSIDFDDLEEKLSHPDTALFLLCNPHNPTGRVFSREELKRMGKLCLQNEVLILSDEIHCDYAHSSPHIPLPALSPALAANTLVSINPSKTFNIAGLHTAAVLTENPELHDRLKKTVDAAGLHPNILGATAFHAVDRGSNPLGDAKEIQGFT